MNITELVGQFALPLHLALMTFPPRNQVSGDLRALKMTSGEHSDRVMLEQSCERQLVW